MTVSQSQGQVPPLPTELLSEILSYLSNTRGQNNALLSCSQVCRAFEALTLRQRFQSIVIDCNDEDQRISRDKGKHKRKTLATFLELLETSPHLPSQIQELHLVHPCDRGIMDEYDEYDPYHSAIYCPTINILLLSAILQRLSHLRQLELHGVLFKRPLSRSSFDVFAGVPPLELHLDKLKIDFGACQSLRIHNVSDILDVLSLLGSAESSIGELHLSNFECMFSGPQRGLRELPRIGSLVIENIFPAHGFLRACVALSAVPSSQGTAVPRRCLQRLDVACKRPEDLAALVEVVSESDVKESLTHLALTLDDVLPRSHNDHDLTSQGLNLSLLPNLQSLVLRFRMATWCSTGEYNRLVWTRISRLLSTLIPLTSTPSSMLSLRTISLELGVNGATPEHFLALAPVLAQIDETLMKIRPSGRTVRISGCPLEKLKLVHRKSTLVKSGELPRDEIEGMLPRLRDEGMLSFEK